MIAHGIGNLQKVSARALNAGIDMDMVGEGFLTTLQKSLDEGKITQSEIDRAVRRILESKYRLGLFDDPYKYCDAERGRREIYNMTNREAARNIAARSMVLMENKQQTLPLRKSGTIALIGPLANNPENMPGTWSVAARHSEAISLLKGLQETVGKEVKILCAKGCNFEYDAELETRSAMFGKNTYRDSRPKELILQEALSMARQADVIVAALGESSEMSGECSSRTRIDVPQSQRDLLVELKKTGKPVVLVLFTGRPLVLNEEKELADAILNVWFPGSEVVSPGRLR